MKRTKEASIASVALLLALVGSAPLAASLKIHPVLAQASPTGSLPTALPSGTTIGIDGSSSMATINQALKQRFEQQFPGTAIKLGTSGTAAALQAVLDGKLDLAAIGRPLTNAEKAKGLVAKPLSFRKIAIVVGAANPFKDDLTFEQFAKIFRGEITDWSQVGGAPGAIRLVDRPDSSDTRQAFQKYPVFQAAPFKAATGAVKLSEDSTDEMIKALGKDGIGYAIVDQVTNNASVQIVPMHNTLPTDPRYPFSQPLSYAYKGPAPNAGVKAFLGYAVVPDNQQVIETPKTDVPPTTAPTTIAPSPEATVPSPAAEAPAANTTGFPWWLLLAIPLLGGLLWWLLKDRGTPAASVVAAAKTDPRRLILTPRNCKDAYAYWEVPEAARAEARRQGGETLALRVYDVTDIDLKHQKPHSVQQFDCHSDQQDLHVPIPVDNRDYLAELGYVGRDDRWFSLAKSEHVRVPACDPVSANVPDRLGTVFKTGAAVAGLTGVAVAAKSLASDRAAGSLDPDDKSRLIVVPRNADDVYAYWEVSGSAKETLRRQGGEQLALRLHDVTGGIDLDRQLPHSTHQFDCNELSQDRHIPLAALTKDAAGKLGSREYIGELGYTTDTDRWLKLARSAPVQLPGVDAPSNLVGETVTAGGAAVGDGFGTALKVGGAAIAGTTAAVAGAWTNARAAVDHSTETAHKSDVKPVSRIILVPRNAKEAYAYWEVSEADQAERRRQGGEKMVLRVYEVTGMDMDSVPAHSVQSFECRESDQDRHVPIPVSDRDYVADIGYTTRDGRWLSIIRSFHVRVPAA